MHLARSLDPQIYARVLIRPDTFLGSDLQPLFVGNICRWAKWYQNPEVYCRWLERMNESP